MKIYDKKMITILGAVVFFFLLVTGQSVYADSATIGIVQYVEHDALDAARQGFLAAIEDNYSTLGLEIEIDYHNAQGDGANLSTISDRLVARNVDLVLAIATPAAQSIAGKTTSIPILGTAITDYVSARLVDSDEKPGGNVSGTSDMNPIKEQIELLLKMVPDAKTIGVLYTSSEDNSVLQAAIAKDIIEAQGLKYEEVTISNSNEVQQAVQSIVRKVDAIYIPTDNIFASAMPVVHSVTSESKTVVVPGEAGMARAGGAASLAVNYYDLGYQTGLMAIEVLQGTDIGSMPIQQAAGFDYIVNGTIAREIGLEIPEELLKYVVEVD